jgi:hypothetical protein
MGFVDVVINFLRMILAMVQIFAAIWGIIGKMIMFSWPVSLVLAGILISEFPHAPKRWEGRFCSALLPIGISVFMVAWAVATLPLPFLRFGWLGMNLGMAAMALQILSAAYAFKRCDGYRCFFLALLLNELWIGYWASLIAGVIIARPGMY